jgi:hypothetical protein
VGLGDKIFFGQCKFLESIRVMLTKCDIHKVLSGEFRNRSSEQGGMTGRTEIPKVVVPTAGIEETL